MWSNGVKRTASRIDSIFLTRLLFLRTYHSQVFPILPFISHPVTVPAWFVFWGAEGWFETRKMNQWIISSSFLEYNKEGTYMLAFVSAPLSSTVFSCGCGLLQLSATPFLFPLAFIVWIALPLRLGSLSCWLLWAETDFWDGHDGRASLPDKNGNQASANQPKSVLVWQQVIRQSKSNIYNNLWWTMSSFQR